MAAFAKSWRRRSRLLQDGTSDERRHCNGGHEQQADRKRKLLVPSEKEFVTFPLPASSKLRPCRYCEHGCLRAHTLQRDDRGLIPILDL